MPKSEPQSPQTHPGPAPPTRKIGQGHAEAMFRQGFKELRNAMYPESNVTGPPELGLYGTLTPGEISESRRAEPSEKDIGRWDDDGGHGPKGPDEPEGRDLDRG